MCRRNPRFKLAPLAINVAMIAGGAWLVYWLAKKMLGSARDKVGEQGANLLEWFFPFDAGDKLQYKVLFPDGSMHAVGSRAVAADGTFTVPTIINQGGQKYYSVPDIPALRGKYRLAVDKSVTVGVNKRAIRQ